MGLRSVFRLLGCRREENGKSGGVHSRGSWGAPHSLACCNGGELGLGAPRPAGGWSHRVLALVLDPWGRSWGWGSLAPCHAWVVQEQVLAPLSPQLQAQATACCSVLTRPPPSYRGCRLSQRGPGRGLRGVLTLPVSLDTLHSLLLGQRRGQLGSGKSLPLTRPDPRAQPSTPSRLSPWQDSESQLIYVPLRTQVLSF